MQRRQRTCRHVRFELCHVATRQTMLSMPLAHPSTLDRRNRVCATAIPPSDRGGVLEPGALVLPENCKLKQRLFQLSVFRAETRRDLSLSGGASFSVCASQAGHLPLRSMAVCVLKRRRRPRGSPSLELLCAFFLAHAPRYEGLDVIRPAAVGREQMPARQPGGLGRFGERSCGDGLGHVCQHLYRSAG